MKNISRCFKFLILAAGMAVILTSATDNRAQSQSPGQTVVAVIEKGLSVLADPAMQTPETIPQRRDKLWEILEPVFGFEEIGKRVLGRYWPDRTPEEQQQFTALFKEVLKNSYLGKTDSYQGEKIVYLREITKDGRGKVQTHFFTVDGKQYVVDFSLFLDGETWKIYDATVEGVSVISTYRTQFYEILENSNFQDLMTKLQEKVNVPAAAEEPRS